ncbi:hypothetical protein [Lysobacter sp. CA196]|uniref:hypothetical protein n=1 Tax=Lysobacter sp. CA196 TaxID=3455606 RepID=UPI003F8CF6AC
MTGKAAKPIKITTTTTLGAATCSWVGAAQAATAWLQVRAANFDAVASAVAVAAAVRRRALAKATEDPEGGPHGCGPFFIGTGMSRMKKPCVGIDRAGLLFKEKQLLWFTFLLLL